MPSSFIDNFIIMISWVSWIHKAVPCTRNLICVAEFNEFNCFLQYTRRTYFEADLADQQKELEERSLIEMEEKDKQKGGGDKLKKPVVKKCAPSPRDGRKLVINESKSTASPSPLVSHRTTNSE
jgi:hypothetical protein